MYLYKRVNNEYIVYELNPVDERIENYKRNEMAKVPEDKKVFDIFSNSSIIIDILEKKKKFIEEYDLEAGEDLFGCCVYTMMEKSTDSNTKEILESYYKGEFDDIMPIIVKKWSFRTQSDQESYGFISTEECRLSFNKYIQKNNIYIPINLYYLNLLQKGHLSLLCGKDIKSQLDLFELNELKSIKSKIIEEMIRIKLINKKELEIKLENSSMVLEKKLV